MSLDPKLSKDTAGVWWLEWTPDPTAEGYQFVTPGGQSRTFNPNVIPRVKVGKPPEPFTATVAVLDVQARPPEMAMSAPPPPPPPPAGQGAKIDALFPWLRAYAAAPPTTTSLTPKSGTPANPVVVDAAGQTPGKTVLWDGGFHDFVVRDLTNGGGAFDGIKVAGGCSRFLVQRLKSADLSGAKPQGFASQRGIGQGVLLGAILERCGDNTLAHGCYWGIVSDACLIAATVCTGQHGYGLQMYPGPSSGIVYVTHCTLFGSVERNAIVAENTKMEVHNSILGPNAQAGINLRSGAIVHVHRSCVPGANLAAKNTDGSAVYHDCIADDPDLDPVTFRPRNPAVLAFLGDPDWTPLHDAHGTPYTTPILGAIA